MEQLGIEPIQLLTQVFNFTVMAVVLTYFLYKPILKALADRRKKIEEGLAYTEKAKTEAEKTETKRLEVIARAKEEAAIIVEEAKKSAKLVESEIIAKAHEEAKAIVAKGKSDIETERADMERKLKNEMIAIASAIAGKAISQSLTAKDHKAIIDRRIKAMAKQLS